MDEVQIERDGPVATVTMNRPEVLNAATHDMWAALRDGFRDLGYDRDVRVVVVTGAGSAFCSGADVSGMGTRAEAALDGVQRMRQVAEAVMALHEMPKPAVAKVNGVAAGAGCNLALGCDLIVASDQARFSEIFARRGLSLDFGGSWLLPRLVGLHRAKELAFFADVISAKEAADMGLVNRVVPHAELDAFVDDWARRLAEGPPLALAASKVMLNNSFENSMGEALIDEGRSQALNFHSDDVKEAARAWAEKRDPEFEGR